MLDDLNELRTFQAILATGSLSAAGRALGVSLAVVSKRLAALERRTGLRLLNRTTRTLSPTEAGARLSASVDRALEALGEAEEQLATGRDEPVGTLRVSAPVSFGRRHVAPVVAGLMRSHPGLDVILSLDDGLVDILGGRFDVAIRIGEPAAGGAIVRRLAENKRILAAASDYLARHGRPSVPADLSRHNLLRYGAGLSPWTLFGADGSTRTVAAAPRLRSDNGDVLHDWCLGGCGIVLRSLIDLRNDLDAGRLERVLPDWDGGDRPVNAVFAGRTHQPRKLRVFLDAMAAAMRQPPAPVSVSAAHQSA